MRKFVLMLSWMFSLGAFVCRAQDLPMAILYSDTTAIFYGSGALAAACDSAKFGDVITLSAGDFSLPTKGRGGVTVRGAGMEFNPETNVGPTRLFSGSVTKFLSYDMTFEGLYFDCNIYGDSWGTTKFVKCKIKKIGYGTSDTSSYLNDAWFFQCKILDMALCYNSSVKFINSYSLVELK